MATLEDKQQFLRDAIIGENLDKDKFIAFMEEDPEKGADLNNYDMEELQIKVTSFKQAVKDSAEPVEVMPVDLGAQNDDEKDDDDDESPKIVEEEKNAESSPKATRNFDPEDEADKESRYYGRKDCVKLESTELAALAEKDQEPTITVRDLKESSPSAPKGDSTVYVLETQPLGWKATRTYKDFQWLHKCLNGKYPAFYIPVLPKKKSISKKNEDEIMKERMSVLTTYISQILSSQELRHSVDLVKFLKEKEAAFKSHSEVTTFKPELRKS